MILSTAAVSSVPRAVPMPANAIATDRWLWMVLLFSGVLKLALVLAVRGHAPVLDEVAYLDLAHGLVQNGEFEGTFRPPLYPAFMAVFLGVGAGTLGIIVAQVLISTLSVLLIYRIGRDAFSVRTGQIAAVIFAFDPVLVAFTHRLWSETLFIFLLLVMVERLLAAAQTGSWRAWATAGIALGLAGLTRPMLLTFAPLLLPWAILHARRGTGDWRALIGRFAILTATTCAVVLPWTLRNYTSTGSFILVDTNGAFNFLVGAQPEAAFVVKDDLWSERFGRVAGQRYEEYVLTEPGRAQELAMTAAQQHVSDDPTRFLAKSAWEAGHLWTLDSFLLRHLRNGWYGARARQWLLPFVVVLAVAFGAGLMMFGGVGLTIAPPSPLRALTLLLIVHSTVLFGLTYALSRYALPMHALLSVFAAASIVDVGKWRSRLAAAPHRTRRAVVLAGAFLLVMSAWVRDVPKVADMLTNRGAEYRYRYERIKPVVQAPNPAGSRSTGETR